MCTYQIHIDLMIVTFIKLSLRRTWNHLSFSLLSMAGLSLAMVSCTIIQFKVIRKRNIGILKSQQITAGNLHKTGIHPHLGEVTLQQLLATWTVHDMTHIAQIVRAIAKQYKEAVGPWIVNLKVLRQ